LSEKDARAFVDFLRTQNEIFKETRVSYLLNEKATKLEVEKHLYYTLPESGKDHTVILYFIGHSAFDSIKPTEFLFLSYDVETEFIEPRASEWSGWNSSKESTLSVCSSLRTPVRNLKEKLRAIFPFLS